MKKNLFTLGLIAVAAFALATSCAKSEVEVIPNEIEQPTQATFELVAHSSGEDLTKTVNSGMSTVWAANDKLTVFHAETTTSSYVKDGIFSTTDSDKDAGLFKGTLTSFLESGKAYDWYVIYPNKDDITTPANTTVSYNVGGRNDKPSTQTANDSKEHLDGSYFPLFGKATGIAYDAQPMVTMNHLASVVEVKVTNNSSAPLTVDYVTFTAPAGESIVGQFKVDFTTSPVTYTNSSNVSETAMLEVTGGSAIAIGNSASFYIGIKPFTAVSGKTLKVSVNGHEKSLVLSDAATFEAGKIKTLNFNYTYAPDVYELVTNSAAFSDGGKYVFALQDGDNTAKYYFLNSAGTSNNLDTELSVITNTITNPSYKYVFTAEAASTLFKFKNAIGNYIANSSSSNLSTNNATGDSWLISSLTGGYFKLSITNATGKYMGSKTATPTAAAAYANSNFKNQHADPASALAQYSGAWSVFKLGGYTPPAGISDETVNDVAARGASGLTKTVTLTGYGSVPSLTATPDGIIITSASVSSTSTTSATITYTIANNYSLAARAGSITVTDTDSHYGVITVNQVADVLSTTASNPFVVGETNGATRSCTIKSDYDWTIDDTGLTGATVSPTSFTYSSTQNQSITITTTGENTGSLPVSLGSIVINRTDGTSLVINVTQDAPLGDPTETFDFSSIYSEVAASQSVDGIDINLSSYATVRFDKNGGTAPAYYTSGTSVRSYPKNMLTVSVSGSKKITAVVFELGGTKNAEVTPSPEGDFGTIVSSKRTWRAPAGGVTSVTFTNGTTSGKQMHYTKIKVYYE